MTDNEIIKALECKEEEIICAVVDEVNRTHFVYNKDALDLINRQQAENEELMSKLECLLCYATGGKLSKHTYSLNTMERYVNDTIQEYCEEAQTEAYKEFAERLKKDAVGCYFLSIANDIDNLLKELVGENVG